MHTFVFCLLILLFCFVCCGAAANAAQRSAALAQAGQYEEARLANVAYGNVLLRNAVHSFEAQQQVQAWGQQVAQFDGMLQNLQQREAASGVSPASSATGAMRQMRSDMRSDEVSKGKSRARLLLCRFCTCSGC
jgi:hypothetical protein